MRKLLLLLIGIALVARTGYSQITNCECYILSADSTFPLVPMTQGTDVGHAPYYHCNNCSSQPIKLPFNFCFYGKSYDTVFVNNKGNLTFVHPEFHFSSKKFPLGDDTLMLAPFYANIDDSPKVVLQKIIASITYTLTATHLIVQWNTVGYNVPDCDFFDNFQITITNGADTILPSGNNVSFCYYLMQWATGDSGSAGFNGTPSIIGVNKGDHIHHAQMGTFDYRGYTYKGPFDTTSELYWLDDKSFIFNTCVSGNNIPPVIIKSDSCYTDTICASDTLSFSAAFLCPQQGQKATIKVSSYPGLSGLTSDTVSGNSIYHSINKLAAKLKDTGSHIITIIATDNGSPPLIDSISYTVYIKNCDSASGINKLEIPVSLVTVYPSPNNGKFRISISNYVPQNIAGTNIEVFNMYGEKVMFETLKQVQGGNLIELTNQPSGVYFYRLTDKTGSLLGSGKFVIQ